MTATSRMLGRWRGGGCGCQTPGPDCAGHDRDTRRRKRAEQRAVEQEIREILRERQGRRSSYLMTYGPDRPPPQAAEAPAPRGLTLAQRCGMAVITYGLIWAVGALVLQVVAPGDTTRLDMPTPPAHGHATAVTTTLGSSPHVANPTRNAHR